MDFRAKLYQLSGFLQHQITPGLQYSQDVFEARLRPLVREAKSWLDLGCGHRLLPEWKEAAEVELVKSVPLVVGLDVDFQAVRRHRTIEHRCLGEIGKLPFASQTFDLVTANMVVEHLADPAAEFAEVARVLTPGGVFVFHTPNTRSYVTRLARLLPDSFKQILAELLEGRASADVYPTFYRANYVAAIQQTASQSGLVVSNIEFVNSAPAFNMFPPLLIPELLWIRQLQRRPSLLGHRPTRSVHCAATLRFFNTFLRTLATLAIAYAVAAAIVNPRRELIGHFFPALQPNSRATKWSMFEEHRRASPVRGLILGSSRSMMLAPSSSRSSPGNHSSTLPSSRAEQRTISCSTGPRSRENPT
jgi:SAM-dependent methyltransferase